MKLTGLELIKAYRNYPERYLPMPDRTGQTPSVIQLIVLKCR